MRDNDIKYVTMLFRKRSYPFYDRLVPGKLAFYQNLIGKTRLPFSVRNVLKLSTYKQFPSNHKELWKRWGVPNTGLVSYYKIKYIPFDAPKHDDYIDSIYQYDISSNEYLLQETKNLVFEICMHCITGM